MKRAGIRKAYDSALIHLIGGSLTARKKASDPSVKKKPETVISTQMTRNSSTAREGLLLIV